MATYTSTIDPTATIAGFAVYADENFSVHEADSAELHHARRRTAALQRHGFGTAIRAHVVAADGRSWCETVETTRYPGRTR